MFRVVILTFFAIVATAPIEEDSQDKIISYENTRDGKGGYEFSFQTSNGISRNEFGVMMNAGTSDEYLYVGGEYSYTDPDGNVHVIRYQADKDGFEILPPASIGVPSSLPAQVVATMLG